MRFITLALGSLGLAGYTISAAVIGQAPALPTVGNLDQLSLTIPLTTPCHAGSTSTTVHSQTQVCTATPTAKWDAINCPLSWYVSWYCATDAPEPLPKKPHHTRTPRYVAQYEKRASTSPEMGIPPFRKTSTSREIGIPTFATTTQPTASTSPEMGIPPFVSQTRVATTSREMGIPKPVDPRQAGGLPICSWNLQEGQYKCPSVTAKYPGSQPTKTSKPCTITKSA